MAPLAISLLVVGVNLPVAEDRTPRQIADQARQVCQAEAAKTFGREAAELTDDATPPKERRKVRPDARKIGKARGLWIGEALLSPTGDVQRVWSLRPIGPEADAAIEEAVMKWQYKPFQKADAVVPLCFGVTVNLR